MDNSWLLLEANAERIAGAAAAVDGAEPFRDLLATLVGQLTDSQNFGRTLDTQPLLDAGASSDLVAAMIRAVESESLNLLAECDGAPEVSAAKWMIRRCVRRTLTPVTPPPGLEALHHQLNGERRPLETEPEQIRLAAFLRGLLAATRDIVFIADDRGAVLYLNSRAQTTTQFTRDDVLRGLTLWDFVPEEFISVAHARFEAATGPNSAPYPIEMLDTVDLAGKDGHAIPVEISVWPLHEGGGHGIVAVARDLRQELRFLQEFRHSQSYLENIIANAPIAIITADTGLAIVDANPASVTLLGAPSAQAILGQPLFRLADTDDPEFQAALVNVAERQKPSRRRYAFQSCFGVTVNCDVLMVPLRDTADRADGILVLALDISEQAALEQSLVQSEKLQALGEIMAGVAHELNNPLTGILGYSQLLMTAKVDVNIRAKLEHIAEEATRCRRIVQNLLSFSRHHDPEMSLQSVNALVEQTLTLREYQLRVDGIELVIDLNPDLPAIKVDPHEIQRVFLNIINNAQQALVIAENRPRKLVIRSFLKESNILVRFEDNGPGIPKDKLSRVFDPFFTTKGVGEGTGLGLSVSYGIVQAHGGHISLTSTEGQGATFTVILPINSPK